MASHSVKFRKEILKMADNEKDVVEQTTNESTTTEVVENSPQENEVDNSTEEVEVAEVEKAEEEDDDVDFDDSLTAEEEEEEVKPKKLSQREKNRQDAKIRREKRELEKKQSYYKGIKDTIGGINPYTNEPLETDEDMETYLNMKEMEKEGLDPTNTSDFIKFMREKNKVQIEEQKKQEEAKSAFEKDLTEFKSKYKDVDIVDLVENDPNWQTLILPQIQSGKSIIEAYEAVQNLVNKAVGEKVETEAEAKAKKATQISMSNVGSLVEGESLNKPLNIWEMSDEEFKQYQKERGL